MKWRKLSNEELAERALIHPRAIQRLRNNPGNEYKVETVIAIGRISNNRAGYQL